MPLDQLRQLGVAACQAGPAAAGLAHAARIGDVPAATAILDRFLHNAEVIAITGKSYRLRNRAAQQNPEHEGRRSTAGNERLSPPEDTDALEKPLSSDGQETVDSDTHRQPAAT